MNVRVDPSTAMFEDVEQALPKAKMRLEWGSWPIGIPYLVAEGEHLPPELTYGSRIFCWYAAGMLRVGVQCYRTQKGYPALWTFAEGAALPQFVTAIANLAFIDVLIFRKMRSADMTEDDVQLLMATYIGKM